MGIFREAGDRGTFKLSFVGSIHRLVDEKGNYEIYLIGLVSLYFVLGRHQYFYLAIKQQDLLTLQLS